MTTDRVVLYGDFNCPWSYLATRRLAALARDGVEVDWRAVEHQRWRPSRFSDSSGRFDSVRQEMGQVVAELLPGEQLPYSLAGFLPYTEPAVSAYAEAYAAGVAARVRDRLFEAFWMHAWDLGDAKAVRTLLVDEIRAGSSRSELLRDWGYSVAVTGGPVTTAAWRLVGQWADEWHATGKETVPVLVLDDVPLFGRDAVEWLGVELATRGLDPDPGGTAENRPGRSDRDVASHAWVSQHGNRWMREYQRVHRAPLFPSAG